MLEAMRTAIVGAGLLLLGAIALLVRVEPIAAAASLWGRVWPVLLFVAAITVVTEFMAEAGVFAVVAERLAGWGLSRAWVLWLLVSIMCVVATVFLSLDTTAVLITPVVITLVRHTGLRVMPFALVTVFLANTASLLLPVSNLTNLLAQEQAQLSVGQFVALSWAPWLVAVMTPIAVVAIFFRKDLSATFTVPSPTAPRDQILSVVATTVLVVLLPLLVIGIPVWIPSVTAALVLLIVFAIRRPGVVRVGLLPWGVLAFALGLFLVVDAAHQLGLGRLLQAATGYGTGFPQLLRLAGVGAASANLVNNLPAFLALEPTTSADPVRVMALLIGVNAAPLITPWASLATLLWRDRIVGLDAQFHWRYFIGLGLIIAPLTVVGSVAALALL